MGWGGESGIAEELRDDLFESIGFVELICLGVVGVSLHKRATDVAKHCDRVGFAPRTYILLYFTRQIDPTLRQPN